MSFHKRNPRLRAYARLNAAGQIVPGSMILRKKMPAKSEGNFVDLTQTAGQCCVGEMSYAIITVTAAVANITGISYPGYSYTDIMSNGDMLVVPLSSTYGGILTIRTSTVASTELNVSTVQGTGSISPATTNVSSGGDFEITIDALPASQYLISLDDA